MASDLSSLRARVPRAVRRVVKRGLRIVDVAKPAVPDIVFVFGCQRSGTTMLLDVFERDLRSVVYRDVSVLSSQDGPEGLRLDPLDRVESVFARSGARMVVAKPIVESQRAVELLDHFPKSKGLWIYRDFRDVAASDLKRFGSDNGVRNLRPIVDGAPDNWRSEGASREARETIARFFAPDMSPYDAAALFWYARNVLFFEQGLDRHPRVLPFAYERFVSHPVEMTRAIYAWLGRPAPPEGLSHGVHRSSVGSAQDIPLSADVLALCEPLLARLARASENAGVA